MINNKAQRQNMCLTILNISYALTYENRNVLVFEYVFQNCFNRICNSTVGYARFFQITPSSQLLISSPGITIIQK